MQPTLRAMLIDEIAARSCGHDYRPTTVQQHAAPTPAGILNKPGRPRNKAAVCTLPAPEFKARMKSSPHGRRGGTGAEHAQFSVLGMPVNAATPCPITAPAQQRLHEADSARFRQLDLGQARPRESCKAATAKAPPPAKSGLLDRPGYLGLAAKS